MRCRSEPLAATSASIQAIMLVTARSPLPGGARRLQAPLERVGPFRAWLERPEWLEPGHAWEDSRVAMDPQRPGGLRNGRLDDRDSRQRRRGPRRYLPAP